MSTRLRPVLLLLCVAAGAGHVRSQTIEDSILVPGAWVGSLAYNPRQDEVWGSTWSGGCAFAIACSSNTVVAAIPLNHAGNLVYDTANGKLYCAYYGPDQESLAVVDGETHAVVRKLEMPGSTIPMWDPVGNRVYVSCQTTNQVAVVDCATDSLLCYIPVGWCPIKMYLNTLRRKLYALNSDAGTVSVIDLRGDSVVSTVNVGGIPNAGYYCRRVDKFYCGGDDSVVVLDGKSDSVVARIPVLRHSSVYAISGNDSRGVVLASAYGDESRLFAIGVVTNTVDTAIQAGQGTYAIYRSPQSDRFYCTSAFTDGVVVLSGDGRQHLKTLTVGDYPYVLCSVPRYRRIYVGHLGSRRVYVIRDADIPWPEGQPSVPDTAAGLRLTPNPFCGSLSVTSGKEVTAREARIFGRDGRLVRVLNLAKSASSVLRSNWTGRDNRGRPVPAGVYFVEVPGFARVKAVKLK